MSKWEKYRTESGLRIFRPTTFDLLKSPLDVEAARRALVEEGVILVTGVLPSNSVNMALASLENDYRRVTTSYLLKEIRNRMPTRRLSHQQLLESMNTMIGSAHPVPPLEQAPVDGVLRHHRLPLTTCAQLRRAQPEVRRIFAQLYGIEDDDNMAHVPDAARVILHAHVAERRDQAMPMGMSPQQQMWRLLNGTWQEPYRNDCYMGYGRELKRLLGKAAIDIGIMGMMNYVDCHYGKQKESQSVSVGPCFVTIPRYKREDMKRVYTLDEMASTVAARKAAVRRYQILGDEELEEAIDRFACILAPAGSLILWRRDMPIAFNSGDLACARPDASNPWKMAYAAQQICWIPRHAQLQGERQRSMNLFSKRSLSVHLYELKTLTVKQKQRRMTSWKIKNKKRKRCAEVLDALNDIPQNFCDLLPVQLNAF